MKPRLAETKLGPKNVFVASTRLGPTPSKQGSEGTSKPGPCVILCFLADRQIAFGSRIWREENPKAFVGFLQFATWVLRRSSLKNSMTTALAFSLISGTRRLVYDGGGMM